MLQPFKMISIEMKNATNAGQEIPGNGTPGHDTGNIRLKDDRTYHGISHSHDASTSDHMGIVGLGTSGARGLMPIGVLMESFDEAHIAHSVCVSGVVHMQADANSAGNIVPGSTLTINSKGEVKLDETTGHHIIGISLGSCGNGGSVDVLLMIGGSIR
ncbi:MAG: hypothetical protein ACRCX2_30135 [Paraclostridium sp.]